MTGRSRISNIRYPISNEQVGGRKSFPQRGKLFSTAWKSWVFLLAAVCAPARADGPAAGEAPAPAPWVAEADWGPLASWMEDSDGNERFRAAGPFWERAESPDGKTLAAFPRPLWARASDPEGNRESWDFLWPVASGRTFRSERSWRFLVAWFFDRDAADPESQYRFALMPVWFHGRDAEGKGYAALFPVGGEIRNVPLRDGFRFVLFPLWAQSRIHDVTTTDVLWPVFSRTTSADGHLEAVRAFPFYARTKNVRQYEKTAVLWPLWTHARYVHPKANGTAWVLFPLVGRVDLNSQKGWMVLPPLFQHVRGEQMTRTYCPWPFFQRETGPVRQTLYLWPLYGRRTSGSMDRRFWLWPLVRRERNEFGFEKTVRWSVAPIFSRTTRTENRNPAGRRKAAPAEAAPETPPRLIARRTKLWPLGSSACDLDAGTRRLRLLDLWPAGHPPPVERSWAPLWTLLDARTNGENRDVDALWGLYRGTRRGEGARAFSLFPLWRHERAAADAGRRWSVLKGLIAYDRTATNRQVRFLWLGRIRLAPPAGKAADPP